MDQDEAKPFKGEGEDSETADLPKPSGDNLSIPDHLETLISPILGLAEPERAVAAERFCREHPEHAKLMQLALAQLKPWVAGDADTSLVGKMIGPYRILDYLGEGGMGTVYFAERKEPMRQRVAIKVIKQGMASKEVLNRFEAERQALAMMNHDNIAKVFGAGTTEQGQPYFVMEYAPGLALTEHCDTHRLGVQKERLQLFQQVCAAVLHAHQKGVIHRDLKPSNILVTVNQGKAVSKIIDFGIARATDHRLTQETLFSQQGQLIGTLEYMSPEQAEMSSQDIDTRTDIYSLGVVLYELLVGQQPFPPTELRRAGLREIQRKIREDEPPKPSTRVSTLGADSEHFAKRRKTSVSALVRDLRGDLDWIVMKAMDKDRNRRYRTPDALADDLKRHLEHEPVLAGPPSAGYRVKKMVRKYRGQVTAAALVFLVLVGGIISTSVGFAKARDNEILATERATKLDAALKDAQTARAAEEEQRERVEGEAARASLAEAEAESEAARARAAEEETKLRAEELEQVAFFQAERLADIDPEGIGIDLRNGVTEEARAKMEWSGLDPATIEERAHSIDTLLTGANFTNLALSILQTHVFETTLETINIQFENQPLVMAQLLQAEARIMRRVGLLASASAPQERALAIRRRELPADHSDTLTSINQMGILLNEQGKPTEAELYFREALDGRRRVLGDDHPDTLTSVSGMGNALMDQGKLAEAERHVRDALEMRRRVLGDDHQDTLRLINNMGVLLQEQDRLTEAEPYYREALDGRRSVLGDEHPDTLTSINNMGYLLRAQGKLTEGEPYYREALDGRRRVLGDNHSKTLTSISNMGVLLRAQGRHREAEPYYEEALDKARQILGDDHPKTLTSINNMGVFLRRAGKTSKAELYFREALDGRRRVLGDNHRNTLTTINNLGNALIDQGKLAEAETNFREFVDRSRRVLDKDHPRTLFGISQLGNLLTAQGKLAEAEPYFREALEGRRRVLGDGHANTLQSFGSMLNLASQLVDNGDFDAAEPLLRDYLQILDETFGPQHALTASAMASLGKLLVVKGAHVEAESILRECLLTRQEILTDDSWLTYNTMSLLGASLAGQGKLAEAEPLLLRAYQSMHPPEQSAVRKREALERLVTLYETWDKPEEAAKWRGKLKSKN